MRLRALHAIQAQTLPRALAGFDVAGQARPAPARRRLPVALLLAHPCAARCPPTRQDQRAGSTSHARAERELAVQIHHDAEILGSTPASGSASPSGGVDYEKQRELEGVDILIARRGA